MLFGLAAGPDPAGMSCGEIERGYKKNQELAKTRSGQHRQNSLNRVKELEPFMGRCLQTGLPFEEQRDSQAILDKIYENGGNAGLRTAPIPPALSRVVYPQSSGTAPIGLAVGLVAAGALIWFVMRSMKKRGTQA